MKMPKILQSRLRSHKEKTGELPDFLPVLFSEFAAFMAEVEPGDPGVKIKATDEGRMFYYGVELVVISSRSDGY